MGILIFILIFVPLVLWIRYELKNPYKVDDSYEDITFDSPTGSDKQKLDIVEEQPNIVKPQPVSNDVEEPVVEKPKRKPRAVKTTKVTDNTTTVKKPVKSTKKTVKKESDSK